MHKEDLVRRDGDRVFVPIFRPKNMGKHLAVDEKNISGNCYTILRNRDTNKIVFMADTLKKSELVEIARRIPFSERVGVESLTRDMAENFLWFGREAFPNSAQITDKFHLIRLAGEQVQGVRTRHRQKYLTKKRSLTVLNGKIRELEKRFEKEADSETLKQLEKHKSARAKLLKELSASYSNGDTPLELLSRSKGLLWKAKGEWTETQKKRAEILFRAYPEIKEAYEALHRLRAILIPFRKDPIVTEKRLETKRQKLASFASNLLESSCPELKNLATTLSENRNFILNYFRKNETNAKAEALNQNIQRFISVNYGARNTEFFFYRLGKVFA